MPWYKFIATREFWKNETPLYVAAGAGALLLCPALMLLAFGFDAAGAVTAAIAFLLPAIGAAVTGIAD